MKGIDLLAGEREVFFKKNKKNVQIRFYSFLALLVFVLITAGIYTYSLILQGTNDKLLQQLTFQRTAIDGLKNVEGLQTVLVQRLASLNDLFTQRDNSYSLLLDLLQKIMSPQVSLVSLTQKSKLVSLSFEASDAAAFDVFMTAFNNEIDQKNFPFTHKIEIVSVNRTLEGLYDVVINLSNQLAADEISKP
ncbi:MAG: hypothetical protein ABH807_02260 [Candidatus Shapirobacteria bacterium]